MSKIPKGFQIDPTKRQMQQRASRPEWTRPPLSKSTRPPTAAAGSHASAGEGSKSMYEIAASSGGVRNRRMVEADRERQIGTLSVSLVKVATCKQHGRSCPPQKAPFRHSQHDAVSSAQRVRAPPRSALKMALVPSVETALVPLPRAVHTQPAKPTTPEQVIVGVPGTLGLGKGLLGTQVPTPFSSRL